VVISAEPQTEVRPVLLDAEGVSVHFGSVQALAGVDLEIRPGELVALAGENGAGKSTLVRCISGDMVPDAGRIIVDGRPVTSRPGAMARRGVAVVWQDLALCDNLDVASNLLLGNERRLLLPSETRFHAKAAALLEELRIPLRQTSQPVSSLSGGQRQLLAVARAMRDRPDLLILDEPTAALGVAESAQVEELIASLHRRGTTILLVSHDIEQMFRLADRIVVLRHGRVVADANPARTHPDDVVALIVGQEVDASARTQLSRLHGLVDRLASADPASSLTLILSALGTALGTEQLSLHIVDGDHLRAEGTLGLPPPLRRALDLLPVGSEGGPIGRAAATGRTVFEPELRTSGAWARWRRLATPGHLAASFSVPVMGTGGVLGVVTVFRQQAGRPLRDELDLVTLYAGHAAAALEREQLLGEVTARNRVLETIREVLETLAGPASTGQGLLLALQSLREGLWADEVGLLCRAGAEGPIDCRAIVDHDGPQAAPSAALSALAEPALAAGDGPSPTLNGADRSQSLLVAFDAPTGPSVLAARWGRHVRPADATALLEDAANSLRLALEREEAERAHREATTLRRTQQLQREFLSRLSHELRTPLTAIRGYASSLMQPDVTWDGPSQERFLTRIAAESARLGRLVDDLLDFSAIESSVFRLHPDWCDLPLVIDAAVACLSPEGAARVEVRTEPDLPVVWADHDRLEQVFVNLLDNSLRHNPPTTRVRVDAMADKDGGVMVTVADDGRGVHDDLLAEPAGAAKLRQSPTAGAGLGLSITRGIIDAHGGSISLDRVSSGSCFRVLLPVERTNTGDHDGSEAEVGESTGIPPRERRRERSA
jgi:ABC-type multidrug transport system ATPase subunit/signal transduction histidine kinase